MTLGTAETVALIATATAALLWALRSFGQSPIVAYLAVGALVGPTGAALLPNTQLVGQLGEIGVTLLLFFIGLEFHVEDAKRAFKIATLGTLIQILATAAVFALLAPFVGITGHARWVVGFAMALSSTAIVIKAFVDRREEDSLTARTSVALLVGQDVLALVAMALLPLIGSAATGSASASGHLGLIFLPILFLAARVGLPWTFERLALAQHREAFTIFSVTAVILVATAAHALGAGAAFGAFLGGLVLAGSALAPQIRAELVTIKDLSLALFFISVGLNLDLKHIGSHLPLLLGVLLAVTAIKLVITTVAVLPFRIPMPSAIGTGVALSQVGEFAFVLTQAAGSMLGAADRQFVLSVAVLSMLPAPALVNASRKIGRSFANLVAPNISGPNSSKVDRSDTYHRAVVVGYGPVGITLCNILIKCGVTPSVIDINLETVRRLKSIGRSAVYGDASRPEILEAAGIRQAHYLVLTLPDMASRMSIIAQAKALVPDIHIVTRARYLDEAPQLIAAGIHAGAYEEVEVAAQLARVLLRELGATPEQLDHEVERLRREIGRRSGFTRAIRDPSANSSAPDRSSNAPPHSRET